MRGVWVCDTKGLTSETGIFSRYLLEYEGNRIRVEAGQPTGEGQRKIPGSGINSHYSPSVTPLMYSKRAKNISRIMASPCTIEINKGKLWWCWKLCMSIKSESSKYLSKCGNSLGPIPFYTQQEFLISHRSLKGSTIQASFIACIENYLVYHLILYPSAIGVAAGSIYNLRFAILPMKGFISKGSAHFSLQVASVAEFCGLG